jgi:putative pyruvate formate lyase activating enzyme
VFCQNYKISQEYKGSEISVLELADEFLKLQKQNVNNINLVTGFMYVPQIIEAIKIAKEKGLNIPIVYNTSGYEAVETLKMLEGYVDIYLPDFKYFYNELGEEYSKVKNYFEVTSEAIKEMKRQVPENIFDENGIMKKGVIIRHLVLPNHIRNSKRVLKNIKDTFGKETLISVMAQYFPSNIANKYENINRKLNEEEYESILEYLEILGLENGFIQDLEDEEEKYVPKF